MKFLLFISCLFVVFQVGAQPNRITELQKMLQRTTDPEEQINLLCDISKASLPGSPTRSLAYSIKAMKLASQHDNKNGLALAYNRMGIAYHVSGNMREASRYLYKSLDLRERIGDSVGMSSSYNNVAIILNQSGDPEGAIKLYNKSIRISAALGDTADIARTYHNLGELYLKLKKYEDALYFAKKSIALKELIKAENTLFNTLNITGTIYRLKGDWKKAIPYHQHALKIAAKTGSGLDDALSLNNLVLAYIDGKNYAEALPLAQRSLKIASDLNALSEINQAATNLNVLYTKIGDFKKAHTYLVMHLQYKDSIQNSAINAEMHQLQLAYEKTHAEKENLLLKAERNLKDEQLERNKVIQIFIIVLLLTALVAAFVFFRGKQRLHLVNRLLLENSNTLSSQKEALTKQATLLQVQKQELERLHAVKDRLFSVIAHDLKGPLASLQGLLKLAAMGAVPEAKFKSFMSTLATSQQNALWLLDNLLVWAKSQMQGFSFVAVESSLYDLAQENIILLQPQAQQKGISLVNTISEDTIVLVDTETVKLIFRNLISNAIKFCKSGESVTLAAQQQGEMLLVSVKDTGIGIKKEVLAKLFSNTNYSSNGTANEKGSGLGLTLCKEFVQQNGGTIWVESEAGIGSTFYFTLPLTLTHEAIALEAVAAELI